MILANGVVVNKPVTTPVGETVALDDAELDHVPPTTEFERVDTAPTHEKALPVIGPGAVLTITVAVALVSVPATLQVPAPTHVNVQ